MIYEYNGMSLPLSTGQTYNEEENWWKFYFA